MPSPRRLWPSLLTLLTALVLTLPATTSAATVHSFANAQDLFPSGDANGTVGPANHYPSSIAVTDLEGTVTGVSAELIDLSSAKAEDIDLALEGPDGAVTMLMSDACGDHPLSNLDWKFEDAAPTFLSQLSCGTASHDFKPTNYFEEGKGDDLSADDGPEGPYLNSLAALTGGTPAGTWNLYVLDDSAGNIGFEIGGWELVLEVEPPSLPAPPAPPVAPVPAPPVAPVAAAAVPIAPVAIAAKTGERAKALARCTKKKSKVARRNCRRAAKKLPR